MRVAHNSKLKIQNSKMSITHSYTELRQYVEKWQWNDPRTGQRVTGFNPPQTARNVARLPFYIRFLTKTGHVDTGNCVCLSVDTMRHQRKVQFVESGEIRVVNDILVLEVDGTRFITHFVISSWLGRGPTFLKFA